MKQGYGPFGWIIEGSSEIAQGHGEADGPIELMQSFRAERYGMLAVLRFIYQTCEWQNTWPGTRKHITVHCDNLSLVQQINWHFKRTTITPKNVIAADYDLEAGITATINLLQEKNFAIAVKHVKGTRTRKQQPKNYRKRKE
jgi:hypothetical protein